MNLGFEILKNWYIQSKIIVYQMRYFFIGLFLCFSAISSLFAIEKDSLTAYISTLPDNERRQVYIEETYQLKISEPELTVKICREGISWASDQNDVELAAILLFNLGGAYYVLGEQALALDSYQKSLQLFEQKILLNRQGEVYIALGQLFRKRREFESAKDAYENALESFLKTENKKDLATVYNNLGNLYEEWKGDLVTANSCYIKSLNFSMELKDTIGISYCYDFLSGIYAQQGNYKRSMQLLDSALVLRRLKKDDFAIAINLNNMGEVLKMQHKYNEAKVYFLQSIEISKKINFRDLLMHSYMMLSEIARDQKNYEDAYLYIDLRNSIRDSIINETKNKQIAELKEKYESEKKEQAILSLRKDKAISDQKMLTQKNYFISAISILLLGGIIGWLLYNQQQQKKLTFQRIEQDKFRIKSILQAEEKERIRIARELHDGVGQLLAAAKMNLSNIAEHHEKNKQSDIAVKLVDDAIQEVRSVSHSMMPDVLIKKGLVKAIEELVEKVSKGTGILISFQESGWEERWDPESESVLYRVFQELLSNILKHSGAAKVTIDLNKFEDEISMIVEDDGSGFDQKIISEKSGIGLTNMRSRIEFLGGHFMIDTSPGKGTTTIITIPINHIYHEQKNSTSFN